MIAPMQREIESRKRLLHHFDGSDMLSQWGICPILAVVIDQNSLLRGILLPYVGVSMDKLDPHEISIKHLLLLVKAVRQLQTAGVVHGDICDRNVCVSDTLIQLVDFGENDKDDIDATSRLLVECGNRMQLSKKQRETIESASETLIKNRDLVLGIAILQQLADD